MASYVILHEQLSCKVDNPSRQVDKFLFKSFKVPLQMKKYSPSALQDGCS